MKTRYTIKELIIFVIFGILYCGLEIAFRGRTHISMFFVGGLCGVLIGLINEITPKMPMVLQMLLGSVIVTVIEFISGYILNVKLGLGVWDYSNLPFNIMGQICLPFTFIWFILSLLVIYLDDFLKEKLFK